MEGMYQQLMDDGLVSEGHVSRWGLVQSCRQGQEEVIGDYVSTVSETMETSILYQQQIDNDLVRERENVM
jgi:hypothetical protein